MINLPSKLSNCYANARPVQRFPFRAKLEGQPQSKSMPHLVPTTNIRKPALFRRKMSTLTTHMTTASHLVDQRRAIRTGLAALSIAMMECRLLLLYLPRLRLNSRVIFLARLIMVPSDAMPVAGRKLALMTYNFGLPIPLNMNLTSTTTGPAASAEIRHLIHLPPKRLEIQRP